MSAWMLLLPFIGALLGWLLTLIFIKTLFYPLVPVKVLGVIFQGIVPKMQGELSARIGLFVTNGMFSFDKIADRLTHPDNLRKIMPEIETHIDHFLRVKLKDAMPMVAMFVGDRTITQMKEVFMVEMETLFPIIMSHYVNELQKDLNLAEIITSKLASLPTRKIESLVLQTLGGEFRYVKIAGTFLGFVIGVLQLFITFLTLR
jgi:uncharacterized membrane protein YheB (UPF0754 family)